MASGGNEKPPFPQRHDCSYKEREIRRRKFQKKISSIHEGTKAISKLSDTILNGFEVLWRQNLMCDVLIQSQEKTFKAHKLILVSCSDFFYDIYVEKQELCSTVDLSDITPTVLETILTCMYTGKIHLTELNVEAFLEASIKLGFYIIQDACEEFLTEKTTSTNCLKMLDTAFKYCLSNLSETALNLAAKNFKAIVKRQEFKELPVEQVMALLKRDDLSAESELDVFKAMVLWLDDKRQERLHHASDLMVAVRLPLLSPSTIVDSIESVTHLMDIPDCLKLVKEALHYHCMPARQSLMQSPRTIPRGLKKKTYLVTIGGAPRLKSDSVSKDLRRYNPENNQMELVTYLPEPRHHHAAIVFGGFLYVAGGDTVNSEQCCPDNKVYRYDPRQNTWLQVASMKNARQSFQLAILNGMIYAVGGRSERKDALSSVERYNPTVDKWEDVAPLSSPKRNVAVAPLNGRLYTVGGCGHKMISSRLERYYPTENKWTLRKSLNTPRYYANLVPFGGTLYLVGGATIASDGSIICVDTIEKYTPVTDSWTKVTDMMTPRAEFGCSVLDDKLYVFGGYNWTSCTRLSSVECLDLDNNLWTKVSELPEALTGVTSSVLVLYDKQCS